MFTSAVLTPQFVSEPAGGVLRRQAAKPSPRVSGSGGLGEAWEPVPSRHGCYRSGPQEPLSWNVPWGSYFHKDWFTAQPSWAGPRVGFTKRTQTKLSLREQGGHRWQVKARTRATFKGHTLPCGHLPLCQLLAQEGFGAQGYWLEATAAVKWASATTKHHTLLTTYCGRALNVLSHLIIPGSLWSTAVIFISEIKKLRNREIKQLAWGHTAYKWQG